MKELSITEMLNKLELFMLEEGEYGVYKIIVVISYLPEKEIRKLYKQFFEDDITI